MTDRGTGNAAPKEMRAGAAPPVSVDEAIAYYEAQRWRQMPTREQRAGWALIDEIKHLLVVLAKAHGCAEWQKEKLREFRDAWAVAANEIEHLDAAIPEIIGCAYGEGLACRRDGYGWHGCCAARLRAARLGISVAPDRQEEDDSA